MNVGCLLAGVGLMVLGVVLYVLKIGRRNKCTSKTVGKIVGVHEDVDTDEDGFHSYTYQAVYEYEVDGKTYKGMGGPLQHKESKIPVGGNITIYYDPKDPQEHYLNGGKGTPPPFGAMAFVCGVALTIIAAVI